MSVVSMRDISTFPYSLPTIKIAAVHKRVIQSLHGSKTVTFILISLHMENHVRKMYMVTQLS